MKKFSIFVYICVFSILVIGIGALLNKEEYASYLALGDYSSKGQSFENNVHSFANDVGDFLVKEKLVNEVNTNYSSNNMTSKKLLEMIESDVYREDKQTIAKDIKNSKYITITLGINDILKEIKYNKFEEEFQYDPDVIKEKVEVFKHNYYKIIEEIKDINKDSKIILVGSYFAYEDGSIINLLNEAIKEVASYNEILYVDTEEIKDKYLYLENKIYLNDIGQECLANKVILKIKESV